MRTPETPQCPYCGTSNGLRQLHDGGGYEAPGFICEDCFTPRDDGPCFDDLPAVTAHATNSACNAENWHQFVIAMAMDAFRICIGRKPRKHGLEDVTRWMRLMSEASPETGGANLTVIDEITAERRRQIEQEGWTLEHDDMHTDAAMAIAGAAYALNASIDSYSPTRGPAYWPTSWNYSWWKPKDRRRDLIRSAALIVAEIERLDRAT